MRTSVVVSVALASAAVLCGLGCKGGKVVDEQTKADLERCLKDKAEKDKLIRAEEDENARLLREKGAGTEIVVSIEGTVLTVKPGRPGEVRPIDDKAAGEASQEFLAMVARSRGAIQKCYEQVLKKNTGLQARTVTLSVSASFEPTGEYKSSNFAPSLGDAFDACIRTVASKWTLPSSSPAHLTTFRAQFALTPS